MTRVRIAGLVVLLSGAVAVAQDPAPGLESIQTGELRADVFFLASDDMRGRLIGTPENRLAAEWVRARFERLGLKPPGGAGSFFQPFNLTTASLGADNALTVTRGQSALVRRQIYQDFYPHRFSVSGQVRGPVTFAGFGIAAPALGHDDLPEDAIRGRIVLMLDHEPGEDDPASPFDGVVTSEYGVALRKTLAAQERGALGVLLVEDVHNHPGSADFESTARGYWPAEPPRVERYTLAAWAERVQIPVVQISPALARSLLGAAGRSLEELARAADTARSAAPEPLDGVTVELATDVDRHLVPDRNVLAVLEGSDPALRNDWVLVCAHYDHEGADGPRIFNGADDDASGIVGLLEIAEAYAEAARMGRRPRRSVMFAAWNSEERGLLGAWAFTESPPVPLDRIAAVLNMDMIGRNEEVPDGGGARFRGLDVQTAESNRNAVNVVGTTRSPDLAEAVERANRGIGLELKRRYDNNRSNLMRRSDHWPFVQRGVPALWFHTGLHPDYHTIYDRPEKLNFEKLTRVVRLVYQTSWSLAQQDSRPSASRHVPVDSQ